ncbi:MAG: GCN5 family acetyltransferase [Gemmatimonadales bacterium]|nr:MAG: GCN5 family acetyltransferase [Gemmatimonadales bacterium]
MSLPVPSRAVITVRRARQADIPQMLRVMEPFVARGDLLPRTAADLAREIERYVVAADGDRVVGTGALKPYSPDLAEIIALAVDAAYQGQGVGRMIVERLLRIAGELGIGEVFALTRRPDFFYRVGFTLADKARFPQKVWFDCARCPRQHCCDEIAVHIINVASRSFLA